MLRQLRLASESKIVETRENCRTDDMCYKEFRDTNLMSKSVHFVVNHLALLVSSIGGSQVHLIMRDATSTNSNTSDSPSTLEQLQIENEPFPALMCSSSSLNSKRLALH